MPLTNRGCWGVNRPGDLVALCGTSNYQKRHDIVKRTTASPPTRTALCLGPEIYATKQVAKTKVRKKTRNPRFVRKTGPMFFFSPTCGPAFGRSAHVRKPRPAHQPLRFRPAPPARAPASCVLGPTCCTNSVHGISSGGARLHLCTVCQCPLASVFQSFEDLLGIVAAAGEAVSVRSMSLQGFVQGMAIHGHNETEVAPRQSHSLGPGGSKKVECDTPRSESGTRVLRQAHGGFRNEVPPQRIPTGFSPRSLSATR
jgi:hypothetical protein